MTVGDTLTALGQPENKWIWELARVLIPAIVVIIGWKVVSSDQNKRETRKERRQLLDRTIEEIGSISEDAMEMYTTEDAAKSTMISSTILSRLKHLEGMLQVLSLKRKDNEMIVGSPLREAITMINIYRAEPRVIVQASDVRLTDIYVQSSALIQELERTYQETYH